MPTSAKRRNTAKTPHPQQLSPASAPPLPSPATTANDGPQPPVPASPSSSHSPITDTASIERLIGLAKDSPPDSVLEIIWRHAFEEGVERGIEKGLTIGRDREKRAWGAAGHSNVCITVARPPRGVAVQTDTIPPHSVATAAVQADTPKPLPCSTTTAAVQVDALNPPPPHVKVQADVPCSTADLAVQTTLLGTQYAGSQTSPHPGPTPDPIRITSPPLSWADDVATSLPSLIPPIAPRDLSCLRSERAHPFGALRQRDRRTRRQPRKSRNQNKFPFSDPKCHSVSGGILKHSYPIPPISSVHTSRKPYIPSLNISPSHMSPSSHLDWESDPRLFALSTALKALGWNRGVP